VPRPALLRLRLLRLQRLPLLRRLLRLLRLLLRLLRLLPLLLRLLPRLLRLLPLLLRVLRLLRLCAFETRLRLLLRLRARLLG
jgi:hypothetical protein